MYPFLKVAATLVKARFRPKLSVDAESILHLRVGLSDIDMFMELNHARYFNYMEFGRWDYSYRIGFLDLMRKRKWGVAVGGTSVRFRRRIPFLSKFSLSTKLICHDGRWFYFLQETHRGDRICSSALMKVGITAKDGLIPAPEVAEAMGMDNWVAEVPPWVSAWSEAESQRPWPSDSE
jgi:acyl-CoA thioesterase FadM